MKKLQAYKNGYIYKHNGKYIYQTASGKTKREYDSIGELKDGEENNQTKPKAHEASATLGISVDQEA